MSSRRPTSLSTSYRQKAIPHRKRGEKNRTSIASEIAGLVCAANIAQANGDAASAQRYLATADSWQSQVEKWTVTKNGPYRPLPYYLRLTKDGNPNAGTTYNLASEGPSDIDQRNVADAGFLELVHLGIKSAYDRVIINSLRVSTRSSP